MTTRKKIGFHIPEDDEEENQGASSSQLIDIINQLYKPNGFREQKEFKTSLELVYDLSDMLEVTTQQVAEVMTSLGFQVTTVDNAACFVVYTHDN